MGVINLILGIIQELLSLWEGLLNQDAADLEQYTTFFGVLMVFMVISFVVTAIIQFGYYTYCLKVANRDQSMSYGDLFCAMRHFLKVLGLFFMIGLFTFLWTCLFIIPGIIAQYRYSQAVFIMAEDPRKGIMQCIRESKEMMVCLLYTSRLKKRLALSRIFPARRIRTTPKRTQPEPGPLNPMPSRIRRKRPERPLPVFSPFYQN